MSDGRRLKFDEIGYWSEIKLDIVKGYASAYSRILAAQTKPALHHVYIDAFAGAGVHISKATGEYIPGSPTNALSVQPTFREYYLIDIDRQKVTLLRELAKERNDVHITGETATASCWRKSFQIFSGSNTVAVCAYSIRTVCN